MENLELLIVALLGVVLGVIVYGTFFRRESKAEAKDSYVLLQQQLQDLGRTLDSRIGETNRTMQESVRTQLGESTKIVREVTEGLTKLSETNRQVVGFTEQLRQLQDVLKNPKQRGVLGEYYLETVLKNVLPPGSYQMQYQLGKDEEGKDLIPDAVVFVKDKVIPVDSKFSLENYNRYVEAQDATEKAQLEKAFVNDLKFRIQETAKYIQPSHKTMDFAFMFIPSEGIYYELLSNSVGAGEENLIQRAAGKYKVIIVSPTSFLAYLQTVLQGLRSMQIEDKAQDIIKNVEKLSGHISRYEEYYQKLGNTLATTVNHYNAGYKELGKIDKDVTRITGESIDIDALSIDKPVRENDD